MFVGKWNTEGEAQPSPWGPAGKMAGVDTFEWLPGEFFMMHRWEVRQGTVDIKGVDILGYDARSKVYTLQYFDNFGESGLQRGGLQGDSWTWTHDSTFEGRPLKLRCMDEFESTDVMRHKCEYSTDGTKWMPSIELRGTRAK